MSNFFPGRCPYNNNTSRLDLCARVYIYNNNTSRLDLCVMVYIFSGISIRAICTFIPVSIHYVDKYMPCCACNGGLPIYRVVL